MKTKTSSISKKPTPSTARSSVSAQQSKPKKAKHVYLSSENGIVTLTLDLASEKVNLLREDMMTQIREGLISAKKRKPKALVINSAKPGCFIAGADLLEIKQIRTNKQKIDEKVASGQSVLNLIEDFPAPTIAVIDGVALGGGLELALACQWRVVSEESHTRLALPEVQLGILPGFGGTQRLPQIVPLPNALIMMTTGKPINARTALKIGLADASYPSAYIDFYLPKFVEKIVNDLPSVSKQRLNKQKKLKRLENIPFLKSIVYKKFFKEINKKASGQYPSPLEIVHVVKKTYLSGLARESRLEVERRAFTNLAVSTISHNLIDIFLNSTKLKKEKFESFLPNKSTARPSKRKTNKAIHSEVKHTGVVGAGIMGGGIAWLFSASGKTVRLQDTNNKALSLGLGRIAEYNAMQVRFQKIPKRVIANRRALVSTSTLVKPMPHLDFVIEAVSEKLDLKQSVFQSIEKRVSEDAIIASNTSSLPIEKLAAKIKNKQRFLGVHFFNPVNRMPLVEIIPSSHTSGKTLATTLAFIRSCGKTAVVVKDSPGFLVNRILFPYMNEAVRLLSETGSVSKIDSIFSSFGMPMGPLRLLDEVGLDVAEEVAQVLETAYGKRMEASALLRLIRSNTKFLGRKSGAGFYLYDTKGKVTGVNKEIGKLISTLSEKKQSVSNSQILRRPLFLMANEAAMCISERIVEKAWHLDIAMIYGIGFPPYAGGLLKFIDNLGLSETVAVMRDLTSRFGERFRAHNSLEKMHSTEKTFY